MEQQKKAKKISDILYFSFLFIAILRHFIENTMLKYAWLNQVTLILSFILGIFIVIKILSEWKNEWSYKDILIAIFTVGLISAANFYNHNDYVWEYLLLILGAKNIGIKKILKMYLIITVPFFALTVVASLLGIIDNLIFYRNEVNSTARYAMGFMYVTDFCAHLFFFCAAYAFIRGKNIKYIEILAIALIGGVCFWLSDGRNSTICIFCLVVVLLLSKFVNFKDSIGRFANVALPLFMPVIAALSILFALLYNSEYSFFQLLDKCMGNRPSMDAEAFRRFHVTLLGQNFNQTIFGGTSGIGFPDNYFFIDCSYVSVLLKMGVIALIAILVAWTLITFGQCKSDNYIGAVILCVIALHCFIEHHILNIAYNPFFLILFASQSEMEMVKQANFSMIDRWIEHFIWNKKVIKNCLSLILFSVVVEVLAFNMESLTSAFKSYINSDDYDIILGVSDIGDYGMYKTSEATYIRIENIDKEVSSMYISLNLYSADDKKLIYDKDYTYFVYGYNVQTKEYEAIDEVHVNTSSPYSGYVKFDQKQDYDKYLVGFYFDTDYQFEINTVEVNGAKPFHINYIRLLIIYLLLVFVYYFGIEKRNAEVSPETIEVAKASNQFESTGALRCDKHRNMQAVYDAKNPFYIFVKRAFDVVMSGIAIILLSPIFLATAIAIKVEDNGPVFFVQMRAGKNLKPFKMWKFRSMYVNADEKLKEMMKGNEQTGHAFKIKNDPRITKVGKFIRKFSIDELPQLFNVFLGDMSIVGPRPILVFQMEECDDYDKQRLIVQPGLTCIWQVSGRANIKWDKWIELDLDYIDKMSVGTDIILILKTIPVVVTGDGAF